MGRLSNKYERYIIAIDILKSVNEISTESLKIIVIKFNHRKNTCGNRSFLVFPRVRCELGRKVADSSNIFIENFILHVHGVLLLYDYKDERL